MLIRLFICFFALLALAVVLEIIFPKRSMAFKTLAIGLFSISAILFVIFLVWDISQRIG